MRTLLTIFIVICIAITAIDIATFVKTGTDERPNEAFTALTALPPHTITESKRNGYFLLLGFPASPSLDPVKTGFDIWLEAETDRGHLGFDYMRPGRVRVHIGGEALDALQGWTAPHPSTRLHELGDLLTGPGTDYGLLIDRYQQWLNMAFEDWGYGHLGSPRFTELFLTHRLYVAGGFAQNTGRGVERLARDLYAWRSVLARAKTLPLKMMAASVVDDDIRLLSGLLGQGDLDPAKLNRLSRLAQPLSRTERSLRWPVQNEFLTAVSRYEQPTVRMSASAREESDNNKKWLAALAGLQPDAFKRVEHPLSANALARGEFQKQRASNTYARYYEATIMASDIPHARLPKLKDFIGGPARAFFDYLVNPVDNIFDSGFEPEWQPFVGRLLETDARLRLVSLQMSLRNMPGPLSVPTHIAQAGDDYYDPFSSMPMLWNPKTNMLYSIGRDGKDDDGDPERDVAVKILVPQEPGAQAGKPTEQAAGL